MREKIAVRLALLALSLKIDPRDIEHMDARAWIGLVRIQRIQERRRAS